MPARGAIGVGWKPWLSLWKAVVAEQTSTSQQRLDEILATITTLQENKVSSVQVARAKESTKLM
jgi:hypothetical protein